MVCFSLPSVQKPRVSSHGRHASTHFSLFCFIWEYKPSDWVIRHLYSLLIWFHFTMLIMGKGTYFVVTSEALHWATKPVHSSWVQNTQCDADSYISPVITEWHVVQKYNYVVTQTEHSHPKSWGALGPERVKRGSNLRPINTKTCNWRIIDDVCAAIATRRRGEENISGEN